MSLNPRVIRAKDLGTKLKGNALYNKLILETNNILLLNILAERTKYWFVVQGALKVQIYAVSDDSDAVDVTHEYITLDPPNVHYYNGYTMCGIKFTSKARSLIFVWYNLEQQIFYTELFFVNKQVTTLELPRIMQYIYSDFGLEHMEVEPVVHDFPEALTGQNNTNAMVPPVVEGPIGHQNGTPQTHRTVTIKATELGRRWTWEAEIPEEGIKCDELYMRGGQACNNVIIQCKQKMYEKYPKDKITFTTPNLRPRRKMSIKQKGQKFLNLLMGTWWSVKTEGTNAIDDSAQQSPSSPDMSHSKPVVITVFELEFPHPPEHPACWIAQACDDERQFAFQLRSEGYDLAAQTRVIEELKTLVRNRLGPDVVFADVDYQKKKASRMMAWAESWLDTATQHPWRSFAEWANSIFNNYFPFGNNNNNNNTNEN
eukprot:TRINITY_DN4090_c0_g1_i1.p2 TRINITY_DN4090_c0_g1~~TRINITY_DN4090_c0_g1_i1.p2  ORF type:complete len:428 (+),score=98.06 TRINITY_DN4090_c0_g1_i1:2361-3644(+)